MQKLPVILEVKQIKIAEIKADMQKKKQIFWGKVHENPTKRPQSVHQ